jgi:hypothetical protein
VPDHHPRLAAGRISHGFGVKLRGTPMTNAARAVPASVEKRAHMRWSGSPHVVLVRVGGVAHAGAIRDISAGGAAMRLDVPVTIGVALVVEINADVRLEGVVVRRFPGGAAVRWAIPAAFAQHIDQAIQFGLGPAEW